jgi:hypothetical protein
VGETRMWSTKCDGVRELGEANSNVSDESGIFVLLLFAVNIERNLSNRDSLH